jgi:glycosyltransferase involved in cell wall biosynthesis
MTLTMEATTAETPQRITRHTATPPAVSVIIPAYNVASYITEALDSALAQTFKDYEIIVINDGSPDTAEFERVLEPYRAHIVYLKQENRGAAAARNTGLYVARGELVAFLDADDWWLPDFLQAQVEYMRHHQKCDLVYANALIFGETPLTGKTYMQTAPSKGEVTFESLITARCNVITSGVVARRQLIMDVGMFDEELLRAHDFDLWLRMVKHGGHAAYQRKVLLNYRVRPDSLSGDAIQQVERELEAFDKIERHLNVTPQEHEVMAGVVQRLQSDLRIERGKLHLVRGDFDAAASELREAQKLYRRWKLPFVLLMLRFAPHMLLRIYKARRAH